MTTHCWIHQLPISPLAPKSPCLNIKCNIGLQLNKWEIIKCWKCKAGVLEQLTQDNQTFRALYCHSGLGREELLLIWVCKTIRVIKEDINLHNSEGYYLVHLGLSNYFLFHWQSLEVSHHNWKCLTWLRSVLLLHIQEPCIHCITLFFFMHYQALLF